MSFFIALFSSMIINNIILSGYKGLCSYLGISKKWPSAVGMGAALTVVGLLAGLVCWGLSFLLRLLGIEYMKTVIFILIIASLVQILEIVTKKFLPSLYKALGIYLPLITTNCVILGLALSVASMVPGDYASMGEYIGTVLGTILGVPLGYFLVLVIFSAIQSRMELSTPHKSFKGAAIGFICTAFMALAFLGLGGFFG